MAESNPTVALLPEPSSLARDPKAVEDLSVEVDQALAKLNALDKLAPEALTELEEILGLEKRARQVCDGRSVSRLCCAVMELHKTRGSWDDLNKAILSLSRKRSQLKRPVSDMTALGLSWLPEIVDREVKLQLIRTLRSVTEGKIFLEVEQARLVRYEAEMLEEDGDIKAAALLMQEVQVEAFSTMERLERSYFILDQMRLVFSLNDFVRCQILSKKINPKVLEESDNYEDVKLKYYKLMVHIHLHEGDYLSVAKCYWKIFDTPCIKSDPQLWSNALAFYIIYLVMSPHNDEVQTLVNAALDIKELPRIPYLKHLVNDCLSTELVDWPLEYEESIRGHPAIATGDSEKKWAALRRRFLQHNVMLMSKYFRRVSLQRMGELLDIPAKEVESVISELVCGKLVAAKIDRPAQIVKFGKRASSAERLDEWVGNIARILDLVQETTHLIDNDRMVYAAKTRRRELDARRA